ncbi:MAG: acyltransferase [Lachnospiraceae bacterium]|nr:acyltransferase [Lachnospiraceae bacterium]
MKNKREANFELLRIVSMFMITVLHYMNHGGMLTPWHEGQSAMNAVNGAAWLIEAFCLCGMSCFILLSGYFLVPEKWKLSRVVSLILQCLFYSLAVPVIAMLTGAVNPADIDVYDVLDWFFPIATESWWFMTSYISMYILSPLLSYGAEKMGRHRLGALIIFLIFFESVEKTILPVILPTDGYGYDAMWMITMFLTARYIRLYGIGFLEKPFRPAICYTICCLGMYFISLITGRAAALGVDGLKYYSGMPYTCNYFLCMSGSIALFYMFKKLVMREGYPADFARAVSPLVLGAYLIHEHPVIREIWPGWLFADSVRGTFLFIPGTFAAVTVVMAVGCICELLRSRLFSLAQRPRRAA